MIDILTIAGLTIREAYRRAILWVALALSALFLLVYGVGFYYAHLDMLRYTRGVNVYSDTAFNFILMAGFYVVAFLGVVIAVLMSVGSLSGEIASHTIQSLATKPIRRGSLVLGKWLGLAGMLAAFLVVLSAGLVAVTWGISGYVPPRVVRGVALIVLQALVMLSLGLAASARLSTVANGVLVFLLYGVAFVGGWMEQVGSLTGTAAAVEIGILSSLLVPSEAIWKMAADGMQPALADVLRAGPFSVVNPPSQAMLVYALLYTAGVIALAVYLFGSRDL
jgi:Cu-processing system permease protein